MPIVFNQSQTETYIVNRKGLLSISQDLRSGDSVATNQAPIVVNGDSTLTLFVGESIKAFGKFDLELLKSSDGGTTYTTEATLSFDCPCGPCTMTASNDQITFVGHGLSVNDRVLFQKNGGTLGGGVLENLPYFVESVVDVDNFTISLEQGGSAVDITSDSVGTVQLLFERNSVEEYDFETNGDVNLLKNDLLRVRFIFMDDAIENPVATVKYELL